MKKILLSLLMILLMTSLIGCNKEEEGISRKEAEEIATEQLEQDLQKYNKEKNHNIKMNDIELLRDETVFGSNYKAAWEVYFNYKDSTNEGIESSVAHYSIDLEGIITRKTTSF
ncbi:hypothetical protein WAK64_14700 [Bacillus spongiae]|uniref:DUF3887 domain-containing protein n=1 Tax=Bacillus spongiae TaxID=2683610 RepID=A0ABU8HG00_9BACI